MTRLLSRSGRILAGISSNMGITLLVEREKGILRGRARTEEDAKEANRVLKLKVSRGIDDRRLACAPFMRCTARDPEAGWETRPFRQRVSYLFE